MLGWAMPMLVAIVTITAFLPALRNGFVSWDDERNFVENPIFRGLGFDQLRWMWTTFHMGHYVPLSWMTLGADYVMWGMNPKGYHLTSLLLHAANAVVVYFLARAVFERTGSSSPNEAQLPVVLAAGFSALLFAVHPLRVESVAWATERRDVLSALFYFSSILVYLRSRDTPVARRSYWISLTLFLAALLSKATSMSLPAVLLILNVYPLRRLGPGAGWTDARARRVYLELAPFALLAAATAGLSIVALHPPNQLGLAAKLAVSAYSLAFYVWKTIAPVGLAPLYEMPQHVDPTDGRFFAAFAVVLCLAGLASVLRNRRPGVTTALVVFFVVTLPMLGVVQNGPQIAADRYTYHAAPALALLAGATLFLVLRIPSWTRFTIAGLALISLSIATVGQIHVWRDSETLWSRVLVVDPSSSLGHSAYSSLLFEQDRIPEGFEEAKRAVELAPGLAEAHNDLGVGLTKTGDPTAGIAEYQRSIVLKPSNDEAENNWGVAEAQRGNLAEAMRHYQRAIDLNPDYADAHVNIGNLLVRENKQDDAIAHYTEALRIRPDEADAHFNWGVALAQQGKYDEAIAHFRQAVAIRPNFELAKQYIERATQLESAKPAPPPRSDR